LVAMWVLWVSDFLVPNAGGTVLAWSEGIYVSRSMCEQHEQDWLVRVGAYLARNPSLKIDYEIYHRCLQLDPNRATDVIRDTDLLLCSVCRGP
jgi:hypothetical protein